MLREIDTRKSDGITVELFCEFEEITNRPLFCDVNVKSNSESFSIREIPLDKAADVFHHPFAYAHASLTTGRLVR